MNLCYEHLNAHEQMNVRISKPNRLKMSIKVTKILFKFFQPYRVFKKNAINLHHQNFLNHPPLVGLRCPEIQKQRKVIMQFQGQLFQYLHFFFQGSHLLMPIETRKIEQVIKNHFVLIKMGIKSNKKKIM